MNRRIRAFIKKNLRVLFEILQRCGVNVLPKHFYSEIPDIQFLKKTQDWKNAKSMVGILGTNIDRQVKWIAACCNSDIKANSEADNIHTNACLDNQNDGFGRVEASFLHHFITSKRPKKIIQIGCGVATAVIVRAACAAKFKCDIVCIEPYPNNYLVKKSGSGEIKLIAKGVQQVSWGSLTDLNSGDVLFVDSTHVVKPGSDVNYVIFEILPRLKKGVYVHFHDIYFPYDYSRGLMAQELFFSNESVLLMAFLTLNTRYKIEVSLSMLHYAKPEELGKLLPYKPEENDHGLRKKSEHGDFPSSLYIRVVE